MKKVFLALGVACMIGLASCGNSVDSKIDKLEDLKKEAIELAEKAAKGDESAAEKLDAVTKEGQEIYKELKKADLTDAQKERLKEANRI